MKQLAESIEGNEKQQSSVEQCSVVQVFETMIATSKSIMMLVDNKGFIYDVNNDFHEATGFSKEEMRGKKFSSPIVKRDGSELGIEWDSLEIPDSNGNLSATCYVESAKSQDKFLQTSRKCEALIQNTKLGVLAVKISNIVFANPTACKVSGYTEQEILKMKTTDIVHPDDYNMVVNYIFDRLSGKEVPEYYEFRIVNKSGETKWVSSTWNPVMWDGEMISQLTMEDISEKKALEAELRVAHKMESLSTLAGGIAHEFNNVLAIVLGSSELISNRIDDLSKAEDEDQKNEIISKLEKNNSAIMNAGNKAKYIVKQIQAFSVDKSEERELISLSASLKNAVFLLSQVVPKSIQLTYAINTKNDRVLGNDNEIQQVLINLCNNATQAMAENKGQINIEINDYILGKGNTSHLSQGEYLELSVWDNGEGIEPENLEKIFDLFFTTKDPDKGTGLGLSVVHKIVKRHGGKIFAESSKEEGTKFRILFPKSKPVAVPQSINKTVVDKKLPEKIEIPGGTEHILVIDDEEAICNLMKARLVRKGYQVTTCKDAETALDLFHQDQLEFDSKDQSTFGCIITDLTMPGLSGKDLIEKIRETNQKIPIVMHTGYVEKEEEILKIGGQAVLGKPTNNKELFIKLRSILDEAQEKIESVS